MSSSAVATPLLRGVGPRPVERDQTPIFAAETVKLVERELRRRSYMATLASIGVFAVSGVAPAPASESEDVTHFDSTRTPATRAIEEMFAWPATAEATAAPRVQPQPPVGADRTSTEAYRRARDERVAAKAVQAVDDLAAWLQISATEVAEIGRFARRNLSNWRAGSGAYGASSRHLLSVHALVSQLINALGQDRARLWLAAGTANGQPRLDRLAVGEDGLREVFAAAEPMLFPVTRPSGPLLADHDLVPDEDDSAKFDAVPRTPEAFRRAPRRTRRAGK